MTPSKHISEFNDGDIVTRVEPALNDMRDYIKNPISLKMDYSYIGDCLKFIGRTGSRIYFRTYSYKQPFKRGRKFSINYGIFQDGWAYADETNIPQESFKNLNLEGNIQDAVKYYLHAENMEENYKMN